MVCSIIHFIVPYFVTYRIFKLFLANTNSRLIWKGCGGVKQTELCERIDLYFLLIKKVVILKKKVKERNKTNK